MKKIIILIATFLPIFAHAENMCVKDGSVMIVLDSQINGTALSSNATGKTWSTQFSYGIISGIGACSSEAGSTQGEVASNQNITPYTSGRYCYCKMLRPVESVWVHCSYDGNGCVSNCASECASYAASSAALRIGLFSNLVD